MNVLLRSVDIRSKYFDDEWISFCDLFKNILDKMKCVTSDYFLDDYNIRFEGQGFES